MYKEIHEQRILVYTVSPAELKFLMDLSELLEVSFLEIRQSQISLFNMRALPTPCPEKTRSTRLQLDGRLRRAVALF